MASFLIQRPMPERFEHHLREAVEVLSYYRIEALEQLLAMYRERWPQGASSTMFRMAEIQPLLSDKGFALPDHAQKATFLRALFNLRREEFDQQEPQWSTFAEMVILAARAHDLCDQARLLDGTNLAAGNRWSLPLPDCRQEWCPCRWDWAYSEP